MTAKVKKSVGFADIHFREFVLCLGDNPSCAFGPPLSLSWDHTNMAPISVDDYELKRPARRTKVEIHMPSTFRIKLLMDGGYKKKEIFTPIATTIQPANFNPASAKPQLKKSKSKKFNVFKLSRKKKEPQ
uniref:Uncharacterized protein n=1 Tax=Proboscia inermis TaxID=420281 RepID=A0A7S0GF76_9STRA|mmetsp:Transcript_29858/g.30168  ORF Transcript_29858/g.30168 Transcript_29858/m.30168 type:complete len:130 (+) Transcript_29858:105-494(+)